MDTEEFLRHERLGRKSVLILTGSPDPIVYQVYKQSKGQLCAELL